MTKQTSENHVTPEPPYSQPSWLKPSFDPADLIDVQCAKCDSPAKALKSKAGPHLCNDCVGVEAYAYYWDHREQLPRIRMKRTIHEASGRVVYEVDTEYERMTIVSVVIGEIIKAVVRQAKREREVGQL